MSQHKKINTGCTLKKESSNNERVYVSFSITLASLASVLHHAEQGHNCMFVIAGRGLTPLPVGHCVATGHPSQITLSMIRSRLHQHQ